MIATFAQIAVLALAQVGPNPTVGGMPGVPDELANRPPREQAARQPQDAPLGQCLRMASDNPDAALDYAQSWRERSDGALDLAQSAHCLGLAMVQLGRLEEAQQVFDLAAGEVPENNLTYAARLSAMAGNAAMARQRPDEALPLIDRAGGMALAAQDQPLAAQLRVDLARTLVALGNDADAERALAEARDADATNGEAWLLSATLSRRMKRYGEAQQQIERAGDLAPRDPAVGLEAGVIAALSGREQDAIRSFQSVVEVAPDSYEANRAKGYLEQLGGDDPQTESPPSR
ncbi:hypothetical protein E3U23_09075 [Erythrobacter litoralis]|uniref:tetratricopeptide repeat protein n=1 Tax=Erythrobacter litoralis TaxID=39960 RepID=UPI002434D856|nr:tetratricopeptide repeat protein [Erythrobacter litoralis]MDG6079344.1 hypothetical protein [Erythrobacter litoralis]